MYELQTEEITELTTLILAAALDPSKWNDISHRFSNISVSIQEKNTVKSEQLLKSLLSLLTPHINQAFEINCILAGNSLEISVLEDAGNSHSTAIFIMDNNFQLRFCNPIAKNLLDEGGLIKTDAQNRVSFNCSKANKLLGKSINLDEKSGGNPPVSLPITCEKSRLNFHCRFAEVNLNGMNQLDQGIINASRPKAVSITIFRQEDTSDSIHSIRQQFSLTLSEVDVVVKIANGQTLREISAARNVSIHTVRNQLKSAMSKMEIRRQVDVVRVLGNMSSAK